MSRLRSCTWNSSLCASLAQFADVCQGSLACPPLSQQSQTRKPHRRPKNQFLLGKHFSSSLGAGHLQLAEAADAARPDPGHGAAGREAGSTGSAPKITKPWLHCTPQSKKVQSPSARMQLGCSCPRYAKAGYEKAVERADAPQPVVSFSICKLGGGLKNLGV